MFSFPPINNIKDLKQKISHLSLRSPLDLVTTDWHLQQPMKEETDKKNYIEECDVTVETQDKEFGLTFFDGSSPPRIKEIDILSCFVGILLVGDEILQINKRDIKSPQDIDETTQSPMTGLRNFQVRFRRDNFYRLLVLKITKIRRKPHRFAILLQARWRQDMSLGLIVTDKRENVVVCDVKASSLALNHFYPGDIITNVNGEKATSMAEAKKVAIRRSIAMQNTVTLRIVRDIPPLKRITDMAEDARSILLRNAGFWRRDCMLKSIEEKGEVKPQRVHFVPKIESVPFPVDETGKELIATPSRAGGSIVENSSEDEDEIEGEREIIFHEDEDDEDI
uniref:PDZ domain-containing protein n=1 Tax=Meloidogyne javanica TaxID=6303 RepID=A0A915M0T2_MELJA